MSLISPIISGAKGLVRGRAPSVPKNPVFIKDAPVVAGYKEVSVPDKRLYMEDSIDVDDQVPTGVIPNDKVFEEKYIRVTKEVLETEKVRTVEDAAASAGLTVEEFGQLQDSDPIRLSELLGYSKAEQAKFKESLELYDEGIKNGYSPDVLAELGLEARSR